MKIHWAGPDASPLHPHQIRGLDRILDQARRGLVPNHGHLESVRDRLDEAEVDRQRWLLVALREATPVGILDAQAHSPEPGAVTVRQLAVAPDVRGQDIGRRLVEALVTDAEHQGLRWVVAHLLAPDSRGFWEAVGFDGPGTGPMRRAIGLQLT